MSIKEKIGSRIYQIRKERGLKVKELAALTESLKAPRISNWEHGTRSPGPEEAIQLAKALDVSPAYILCLTDDINAGKPKKIPGLLCTIPLLSYKQALNPTAINESISQGDSSQYEYLPLGERHQQSFGNNCFAVKVKDDSLNPEIRCNDFVVVDMSIKPKPGDYVAASIVNNEEILIRQYKQTSYSDSHSQESFELVPLNTNWANIEVKQNNQGHIIGVIIEIRRVFS